MLHQEYIKNKVVNTFNFGGFKVRIDSPFPEGVSIKEAITMLKKRVPEKLLTNIHSIRVGNYSILNDKDIQASYSGGVIYLKNDHSSSISILDDMVHEVAHAVEESYRDFIYSDGNIKREFLIKRKKMWAILKEKGFEYPLQKYMEIDYDRGFDVFLYKTVGYDLMRQYMAGIFYSPYAATSLREYFANGFEAFFMSENISLLKSVSPQVYAKLSKF